jgi:hypothetical protein
VGADCLCIWMKKQAVCGRSEIGTSTPDQTVLTGIASGQEQLLPSESGGDIKAGCEEDARPGQPQSKCNLPTLF